MDWRDVSALEIKEMNLLIESAKRMANFLSEIYHFYYYQIFTQSSVSPGFVREFHPIKHFKTGIVAIELCHLNVHLVFQIV